VRSVAPSDIPGWLSASDAGIAFYRPGISRLGTSPVKVSEYLACGLPVVINAGIGDSDLIITGEKVGVLVENFSDPEYARAARAIAEFAAAPDQIRWQARAVAEKLFDLRSIGAERYARLYEKVLGTRAASSASSAPGEQ